MSLFGGFCGSAASCCKRSTVVSVIPYWVELIIDKMKRVVKFHHSKRNSRKFGEMLVTKCLNTRFPLPILLCGFTRFPFFKIVKC